MRINLKTVLWNIEKTLLVNKFCLPLTWKKICFFFKKNVVIFAKRSSVKLTSSCWSYSVLLLLWRTVDGTTVGDHWISNRNDCTVIPVSKFLSTTDVHGSLGIFLSFELILCFYLDFEKSSILLKTFLQVGKTDFKSYGTRSKIFDKSHQFYLVSQLENLSCVCTIFMPLYYDFRSCNAVTSVHIHISHFRHRRHCYGSGTQTGVRIFATELTARQNLDKNEKTLKVEAFFMPCFCSSTN